MKNPRLNNPNWYIEYDRKTRSVIAYTQPNTDNLVYYYPQQYARINSSGILQIKNEWLGTSASLGHLIEELHSWYLIYKNVETEDSIEDLTHLPEYMVKNRIATSRSEARRLIATGKVFVNGGSEPYVELDYPGEVKLVIVTQKEIA